MDFFNLEEEVNEVELTDEDIALLSESMAELELLPVPLQEKSMFLLDKNARVKKAGSRATILAAKSANDPLYLELAKLNKKRMILKKKLEKKYQNTARKAMKEVLRDGQVRKADIMVDRARNAIGQ
jgi:hypothetical protein